MRAGRVVSAGLCLALLAGCDQMGAYRTDDLPPADPLPVADDLDTPSAESLALAAYYKRVEDGHRTRGLLRADGGGPDVPFDGDQLARTFTTIAFAREFSDVGQTLVRREGPSILHRWNRPVRFEVVFGPAVPETQRDSDRVNIARYAGRLAEATSHPISLVERGGNFGVLILTEDERRVVGPTLRRFVPEIRRQEIDVIQNLDRATYCVVVASDPGDDGTIGRAVAVIRAELPPQLRMSCIHEELAQGLGLANDSPLARPSIFNDDDEFGRLTAMDELMLGMLYDPRLTPGMDAATAEPIVAELARQLTGPGT